MLTVQCGDADKGIMRRAQSSQVSLVPRHLKSDNKVSRADKIERFVLENFTAVRFIIKIGGRLAVRDLRYCSHTETETDLTEDQQFSLISQAQSV